MSYAKIIDGVPAERPLPKTATLSDGSHVSGFDKLPDDVLAVEGWRPVVDTGAPVYNPETETATRNVQMVDGIPTAVYTVGVRPPDPDPVPSEFELIRKEVSDRIGVLEAAAGIVPPWSQPFGGHDAYLAGATVTHAGQTWSNSHGDGNVWEPGVFGWIVI